MDPLKENSESTRQTIKLVNPFNLEGSCVLQITKASLLGAGIGVLLSDKIISEKGRIWSEEYLQKHKEIPQWRTTRDYLRRTITPKAMLSGSLGATFVGTRCLAEGFRDAKDIYNDVIASGATGILVWVAKQRLAYGLWTAVGLSGASFVLRELDKLNTEFKAKHNNSNTAEHH